MSLNVKNSYPYDYAEAMEFLLHFDEEIEVANPGAAELLIDMGVDAVYSDFVDRMVAVVATFEGDARLVIDDDSD